MDEFLTESQWQKIGIRHHHGISIPLGCLHSAQSAGCGDFESIKPLFQLLRSCNFDVLQLLPVNDTGLDSSPYMCQSGNALNPIYLHLPALPGFFDSAERIELYETMKKNGGESDRYDYLNVLSTKWTLLCHWLDTYESTLISHDDYIAFCSVNQSWLEPYATFKALKEYHQYTAWWDWKKNYQSFPCHIPNEVQPLVQRWKIAQFLAFQQLASVKKEAEHHHIFLKGDVPILLNKDSADVWANPDLFSTSYEVGAPPDMYSLDGQRWGFPPYNWKAHLEDNLSWWKSRLRCAETFYHMFRLDHVVGFYRFFVIPPDESAKNGTFIPSVPDECLEQGESILQKLTSSTSMLPIGEDLGDIPNYVRTSLSKIGIPGNKVMRWEREWKIKDQPYIPLKKYTPESVTMVSTHDSSTLKGWMKEQTRDLLEALPAWGILSDKLTSWTTAFQILKASHHTSSLFHINLLTEYLSLFKELSWDTERANRINIPGSVSPLNWTIKLKPSVEALLASKELQLVMKLCSE